MNTTKIILTLLSILGCCQAISAHPGHDHATEARVWTLVESGLEIEAMFMIERNGQVQLSMPDHSLIWFPIEKLSNSDQQWLRSTSLAIRQLNEIPVENPIASVTKVRKSNPEKSVFQYLIPIFVIGFLLALFTAIGNAWQHRTKEAFVVVLAVALIGSLGLVAAEGERTETPAKKHFESFKEKLELRVDENFLYVGSTGFPDHPMMVGIKAWQQQVPLPQRYTGANAWRIPLQPKLADKPVSAKKELFRGAIALAVNGVPIFNPIKNDGKTDTYIAGELDEFGGHCGRADDYHYHIAPIHLEKIVGKGNPIGYALDGFPLYGYTDANGKIPTDLDEFNGRMEKDGYRYYSTPKYPYVNGGLRGIVTVKDDQIDPQPRANSVRPDGKPLRGAKITSFTRDDVNKTYTVKYDLSGKIHSVKYTINADGTYSFLFIDAAGKETAETYRNRREGKGENPPKKDNPPAKKENPMPKKDGDTPRLPWLGAHFDELDTDKDGILTLDELKKELEKSFAGYDANKDGKLTKAEYDGKGASVKSALAGFVKGHAAEFSDKDGTITKEALTKALIGMFEKADRKKAGKLTKTEASQAGPKKSP